MRTSRYLIVLALTALVVLAAPGVLRAAGLEPLPGKAPSPEYNPTTKAKVELGKKLFFDRRLSGDGTMSCATCHNPELGFTDGLAISLHYPTTKNWRNSPTVINTAFKKLLFYDGRADTLEQQALFPMMSAFEMNQNLDYMEQELMSVPQYVSEFGDIFGEGPITRLMVAEAISSFERTLISRNSPLDRYLSGDSGAMSESARRGMEIFKGKGGCLRCHSGPLLSDGGFHDTGLPDNPELKNDPRVTATVRFVAKVSGYEDYNSLNEDPGRYLVTKDLRDWKAFATPSLREVSRTAPYMHNGVFGTLEDVVAFYDAGGGKKNTSGLKPLGLSKAEKADLVAFLREALTGDDIIIKYPEIP